MQIKIYDFIDYKSFVKAWISELPKSGRGFYRKMSLKLNVSTTLMSQIFMGDKQISLELAIGVTEQLGLSENETEYFIMLVEYEKASSHKLKQLFFKKIKYLQNENNKIEKRINQDIELNDTTKSIFYSNWLYSGIRNLIAISEYSDLQKLSERLQINPSKLKEIIDFLLNHGFCNLKNGKIKVGPQKTFITKDSPWAFQHHQNWRVKALEKMPLHLEPNFFYTGPMSMSQSVSDQIRQDILKFIEHVYKKVGPSPSETVRCLNVDWFEY